MGKVLDNRLNAFNTVFNLSSSSTSDDIKQTLQYKINDEYEFASDINTIQEEQTFGKLNWSNDFTCRITHIISDKNTGEKLGDDFRNLIFSDISHAYVLGKRYSFNNNYWITTNTDSYKYPTASACIRRCNNVLNNYDYNKVLHTEPCIIDNKIRSTDFDFNSNIIVPDGYCTIIVQGNDWTKTYYLNQRFMYGGQAWKCTFINNFQRVNTLDASSVNLIRMILMKDALAPDDDKENNIPNTQTYNYTISIDQGTSLSQTVGYTDTLTATVKNRNQIVSTPVVWSSSDEDIVSISQQNGNFMLNKTGSAVVTVIMKNNPSVSATINITVNEVIVDNYEVRIADNITEILQGQSVTYSVFLYKNNVVQSDAFNISVSGSVPTSKYKLTVIDDNHFKVDNIQMYRSSPLVISCVSGSFSGTISINLKGVW